MDNQQQQQQQQSLTPGAPIAGDQPQHTSPVASSEPALLPHPDAPVLQRRTRIIPVVGIDAVDVVERVLTEDGSALAHAGLRIVVRAPASMWNIPVTVENLHVLLEASATAASHVTNVKLGQTLSAGEYAQRFSAENEPAAETLLAVVLPISPQQARPLSRATSFGGPQAVHLTFRVFNGEERPWSIRLRVLNTEVEVLEVSQSRFSAPRAREAFDNLRRWVVDLLPTKADFDRSVEEAKTLAAPAVERADTTWHQSIEPKLSEAGKAIEGGAKDAYYAVRSRINPNAEAADAQRAAQQSSSAAGVVQGTKPSGSVQQAQPQPQPQPQQQQQQQQMVACPVCAELHPVDVIQAHAEACLQHLSVE